MTNFSSNLARWLVLGVVCVAMVVLTAGAFVLAAAGGSDAMVYLPVVAGPVASAGGGTLENGGTVEGPDGVGIGALTDTLAGPIMVNIARTQAPTTALPSPAQATGDYYVMSAEEDVYVSPQRPFLVSLPVPAGTDTAHLALAALSAGDEVSDAEAGLQGWAFMEGMYDAGENRFVTTIAGLMGAGRSYALVTHPDFDSPPASGPETAVPQTTAPQTALPQFDLFQVKCIGFVDPTLCTPTMESDVAQFLTEVHARMVGELTFMEPRLRFLNESLDYDANLLSSLGFTVYIEPGYLGFCDRANAAGYYDPVEGRLVLCLNPTVGLTTDYYYALIHEYFHATEFAYAPVLDDYKAGESENWIIEGMAKSAEQSYVLDEMLRSDVGGWVQLHKVDVPLNMNVGLDPYFAQDFWVFYGQKEGRDLTYLKDVLNVGAKTEDVASVLGDGDRLQAYWEWAKNQVMEKQVDFDGRLQNPCNLEGAVVQQIEVFPHTWPTYLYHDVTVGPLSTLVVHIDFSHSYDAGFGWVFARDQTQNPDATQALGYKFYKDGEGGCEGLPDGERMFEEAQGGIDSGETYYVVISNTDYDQAFDYTITFELPIPD